MSFSAEIEQARTALNFDNLTRAFAMLAPLRDATNQADRHEAYSLSGQAALAAGDLANAAVYLNYAAVERNDYRDWLKLGQTAIRLGRFGLAERAFEMTMSTVDKTARHPLSVHEAFARVWVEAAQFEKAVSLLEPLRDFYPTLPHLARDCTQRLRLPAFNSFVDLAVEGLVGLVGLSSAEKKAWLTPLLETPDAAADRYVRKKLRRSNL
ncbi:MAG: tetratricopeptide repeat protein [Candidatus Promineifilaceae bacterium]